MTRPCLPPILLAALSGLAVAETVVFQQDVEITIDAVGQGANYVGTHDAELREDAPTTNHDEGTNDVTPPIDPEFDIDNNGPGVVSQVVIRFDDIFDTSYIPANAFITNATLNIDIDDVGDDPSLYRLTGGFAWAETTATWNNFGTSANDGVLVGTETVGSPVVVNGQGNKISIDVTADVQAWYDDGDPNNGWVFVPGGSDGVAFDASENFEDSLPDDRPSLTITYVPPLPQDLLLIQSEPITIDGVSQGSNYSGTHDAELRKDASGTNYDQGTGSTSPTSPEMKVDELGNANESHAVIRFDDPFDELPADAVITAANLFIDIDNIGSNMSFYRIAPGAGTWEQTAVTWNNFGNAGNGVDVGNDTTGGAQIINGSGNKTNIDVTADVQAWYAGAANHGWAFLPGGTNGVQFDTSHDVESVDRPALTITFTSKTLAPVAVNRGPYLQQGSTDRISIRWRTNLPGDSVVRYGTTPGSLTATATDTADVYNHDVEIAGLTEGTRYYYQIETTSVFGGTVQSTPSTDTFFDTAPPDNSLTPTTIWVIGDSGTGNSAADGVYAGFQSLFGGGTPHADVWLMLGDNAYNSGTDAEFQSAVFETYPELLRNTVLWPCLGNHDAYTGGGTPYLDIFTLPTGAEAGGVASGDEFYYSFDYANIHFVCIDSETSGNYNDTPGSGGMVDWLEADLQNCNKDWIIAFFHHGPYTKGSHDSDTESHHIAMRQYVQPLLEQYGVDLVMSGHSHCYERSYFLDGHYGLSGTFNASHQVDSGNGSEIGEVDGAGSFVNDPGLGDGAYHKPLASANDGAVYAIAGASGKLSSWDNGSSALVNPVPHPAHLVNLRLLGSLWIEVDGFTLNAKYIDSSGAVRDDFTIKKGSDFTFQQVDFTVAEGGPDGRVDVNRTVTSFADEFNLSFSGASFNTMPPNPNTTGVGTVGRFFFVENPVDNLAEGDRVATVTLDATRAVQPGAMPRRALLPPAVTSLDITLADAPAQAWYFDNVGGGPIASGDWAIDGDGDGLARGFEALFGGTEGGMDFGLQPDPVFTGSALELHFDLDTSITDLAIRGERSGDLQPGNWSTTGVTLQRTGPANPGGIEAWKASLPTPYNGDLRHFLRLGIDELQP